jgi:hypothetical protein
MKLYMFRTVRLSIIRSLFTVHTAMVYVIQVCRQLSSSSFLVQATPWNTTFSFSPELHFTPHRRQKMCSQGQATPWNIAFTSSPRLLLGQNRSHEICAFEQDQDGTSVPSWSCSKAVYKPVWHTIAECTVNKLLMMDRGTVRNMWSFMPK